MAPLRRRGQTLPIVALMAVLLFGIAGLALDGGHLYLMQLNMQAAADAATLAAGAKLSKAAQVGPPVGGSGSTVLIAAHDYAAANGYSTLRNLNCDSSSVVGGMTTFTTSWFDIPASSGCGPGGGSKLRMDVTTPPANQTPHCKARPYNCIEVTVTSQVQNYLLGVLGIATESITAHAAVYAAPPNNSILAPQPFALYLYEQQLGCLSGWQCFDETKAPARANLSCLGGTNNCPTLLVVNGSKPTFIGYDGAIGGGDTVAVQSKGDIVVQDTNGVTFCDPYNGVACPFGTATGARGFAVNTGSNLICSGAGTAQPPGLPACGPAAWGGAVGPLYGNEYTPFSTQSWMPNPPVDTSALNTCGLLILNGDTVWNHAGLNSACNPPISEKYTILPGKYQYIVINHGQYEFAPGLYDITGPPPSNNTKPAGQLANGIDHSQESLAAGDWDICTAGGCTGSTAGIWITHGNSASGSWVAGTGNGGGACPTTPPPQGGGGDQTIVHGSGVTFVFESGATNGLVSTREVNQIAMSAPGFGALPSNGDIPLLFDLESNGFIHLDATSGGFNNPNRFSGIIYQNPARQGGGLELNPGMGYYNTLGGPVYYPALTGQVLVYSMATFGSTGPAVNFSQGLGGASVPIFSTGGAFEPSILVSANLLAVTGQPTKEKFVVKYFDEFDLDAFDMYVKINNTTYYFSEGIWSPAGSSPPAANNPGNANPAYPSGSPPAGYTGPATSSYRADWTHAFSDGSTWEANGDWAWGHQMDILFATGNIGSGIFNQQVTNTFTFTIPSGTTVTITMYMSDGDFCGDYTSATWTFVNVNQPGGGTQTVGTVYLEQ